MRVERFGGGKEKTILTAMIVDDMVLGRIFPKWDKDEGLFASPWANLVAGWCVTYYERYSVAPRAAIESMYESWADKPQRDKDLAALVGKFLSGLSDEYEETAAGVNVDYVTDVAGDYFNEVRARRHAEAVSGELDKGDVKAALKRIEGYGRIEMGGGQGVDLLQDELAVQAAFEANYEPIVVYPGALGLFFGKTLQRDGFIAFMAPEKRGKTWWLMDIAWNGMLQRRRVAFFQVGDLSQNQVIHRFGVRAARHPLDPTKTGDMCRVPTGIEREEGAVYATVPAYKEKFFDAGLTWQGAVAAFRETAEKRVKSKESYLRISTHPNSSLSVMGMKSILQSWERGGWVPDIIIVDYADILAPPHGIVESRDQINATWKQLRSLSQSMHCLVVTATQADAASYSSDTLGRANFSEDKRKFAHVTGMLGINQTPVEKDAGITRLNWLVLRESKFSERQCVHVAGCLDIGNPAIYSCL